MILWRTSFTWASEIFLFLTNSSTEISVFAVSFSLISCRDFLVFLEISFGSTNIILDTKSGLSRIEQSSVNSSVLFLLNRSFIISSFKPFFFKLPLMDEISFGVVFLDLLIVFLGILNSGKSVSGYIRAEFGRGLKYFVLASLRTFRTSFWTGLPESDSCFCLEISLSIASVNMSISCIPFISTLFSSRIETFTSCLIVPMPLLTWQLLSISPIFRATFFACSGFFISGSVTISTSGVPNLSNR